MSSQIVSLDSLTVSPSPPDFFCDLSATLIPVLLFAWHLLTARRPLGNARSGQPARGSASMMTKACASGKSSVMVR